MDLKNRGNARVDVERALIVSKISFARLNAELAKVGVEMNLATWNWF